MATGGTRPEFLAVGHVTVDIVPTPDYPAGEMRYGGAVTFSALTAARLGLGAAVLTSAEEAYPLEDALPGIAASNIVSGSTTTFQNIYGPAGRRQILAARGGPIALDDVPSDWRSPRIALLGPLAREFDAAACSWFPRSITGLVLQGLLRRWDQYGRVTLAPVAPPEGEGLLEVVVASHAELSRADAEQWAAASRVVARTRGERGASLLIDGRWHEIGAPKVEEADPTGAGDVWTAAYLIRFDETGDPLDAARFASAAASLSVTAAGVDGVPGREEIDEAAAGDW